MNASADIELIGVCVPGYPQIWTRGFAGGISCARLRSDPSRERRMRAWSSGLVIGVLCGAVLVSGCSAGARVTGDPIAYPTFVCTPLAGQGSPGSCYEAQWHEQDEKNKLYAEAEAVYRTAEAEWVRGYLQGGFAEATPILKETMTQNRLAGLLEEYRSLKKHGLVLAKSAMSVSWIKPQPGKYSAQSPNAVAAISACERMAGSIWKQHGDKGVPMAEDWQEMVYLVREDGVLKIDTDDGVEVKSC